MSMVQSSSAFVPPRARARSERPLETAGRPARVERTVSWQRPASAQLGSLTGWTAMWDKDTDVPLRMWGPGVIVAGSVADPAIAEAAARRFLADHLGVLAPGAALADFTLVANQLGMTGDVRTVAFEQRSNGLRVIGGSIGFAFKGDHLSLVSSTALPNVTAAIPATHLTAVGLAANAVTWLAAFGHTVREHAARPRFLPAAGERVILPIIHARAAGAAPDIEYHASETVLVESTTGAAGRWQVYLDAATGAPLARESVLEMFTGTLLFDAPDQSPSQPRGNPKPAPFLNSMINGLAVTSDGSGVATFTGTDPASVQMSLAGTFVVVSDAAQALATATLPLPSEGSALWTEASLPASDAELDAYIAANRAKAFVKAQLHPNATASEWLAQQLSVTVNEGSPSDPDESCNAYSTGDDIHFYVAGPITLPNGSAGECENTGRMADVVMHESGHSVHNNSVIPGQGAFGVGGARGLSEGLADTLAVSITGDHGLGRGFFLDDEPLRELDPAVPKTWPVASGEPHDEGEIIGESLWGLRTTLITKLGQDAGFAQLLKIYYGIMQRSPDIPSSYAEALLADDDDGDLSNGTPDQCEIDSNFGLHNLADPQAELALELKPPVINGFDVTLTAPTITGACPPAATVTGASLVWHTRANPTDATIALTAGAGNTYAGSIPTQADGNTILYQVDIALSDGTSVTYPANPADPYYEAYVGAVTNIYCTGFEPGFDGWTHSGTKDEWQVGAPVGLGGDPDAAHGGSNVVGVDLGAGSGANDDGMYEASAHETLVSPMIGTAGHASVHLQYWRWLGVEDAEFDHATISANGTQVWTNKKTGMDPEGSDEVNHVDHEWVFEDVDLTAAIGSGSNVQVTFGLTSDEGLELGGWTLDDVCIVAVAPAPPGVGSGSDMGSDAGSDGGDGATMDGGGCCSAGGNPAGPALLAMFTLGLVLRRRRRA
jgi:MYXO-CTERM domain-containing protein